MHLPQLPCSMSVFFAAVIALPMGLLAFSFGTAIWKNPDAEGVRRWIGGSDSLSMQFRAPLAGGILICTSLWALATEVQCGVFSTGGAFRLAWTWSPGFLAVILFALLAAFVTARLMRPFFGMLQIVTTLCFGAALGQALGFRYGDYAHRWYSLAVGLAVLSLVLFIFGGIVSRSPEPTAQPPAPPQPNPSSAGS
jgi:hypothetical protein